MKIYVCIKQVPDTVTNIKLKSDGSGIDTAGVKWVINPYDEFAIEEAAKLKKEGKAASITVVSVGPKGRVVDSIRTALAMGADDGIVIDSPDDLDSSMVAKALANAIKAEGGDYKFVMTGRLAIDDNASAVSQMVAEHLGLPHATVVTKLDNSDNERAVAERETEGGTREVIQLQLPAVVAANKGLNVPRYPSLPGIMQAKKKPLKELTLDAVGVTSADMRIKMKSFELPTEKPAVKMLSGDSAEQARTLVKMLHEEAKVL